MAPTPNLAESTLVLIHNIISSVKLTTSQIAEAASYGKRAVFSIRSNLQLFGSIKAPPIEARRPRTITPIYLRTLAT